MWQDQDGRKAKKLIFGQNDFVDNAEKDLICSVEYLGDRSEIWIIETQDTKELARHNVRYIETVEWE